MSFGKLKNLLLLAYLVPLLCLGQSLHHADFIGLHQHPVGESPENSVPICSCQAHLTRVAADSLPKISGKGEVADDACALCDFFEDYHVVVSAFEFDCLEGDVYSATRHRAGNPITRVVSSVARGPPKV